jgi:hypothetical protein
MRRNERTVKRVDGLRQKPASDAELEWFFNEAECDMGIRSNFTRMLGPLLVAQDHPSPEDAAEAAHVYRRIRSWLRAISDGDAGVLQAAYEVQPWPERLRGELGRLTGVVVRLACALDPWPYDRRSQQIVEQARALWLTTQCRGPVWSFSPIFKLRRAAELRFAQAHHAYGAARGSAPCLVGPA